MRRPLLFLSGCNGGWKFFASNNCLISPFGMCPSGGTQFIEISNSLIFLDYKQGFRTGAGARPLLDEGEEEFLQIRAQNHSSNRLRAYRFSDQRYHAIELRF